MSYIYRELQDKIAHYFDRDQPKGLILSGIVGCGKSTLIKFCLEELKSRFYVITYSGDDVQFRRAIIENSKYLYEQVVAQTNRKALIFVDEVQKCEEIFDALKYAFDQGNVSFVVSGSNPEFLSTIARKRLQRRADQWQMLPISLFELIVDQGFVPRGAKVLMNLLYAEGVDLSDDLNISPIDLEKIKTCTKNFLTFGGFPLVILADNIEDKLRELRLVIERGFDLLKTEDNRLAEVIRIELADLHSKEFTYKNILQKTRSRRRDNINTVLNQLLGHGYLVQKRLNLIGTVKTSYLSVFSYIDPGLVAYLTGTTDREDLGYRLEGYIHSRLSYYIGNSVFKSELSYFKKHTLNSSGNTKYLKGEIDFIFSKGKKLIPIEVKLSDRIDQIDVSFILTFIKQNKCEFGVVIYGGPPKRDLAKQLIYWPYWLV